METLKIWWKELGIYQALTSVVALTIFFIVPDFSDVTGCAVVLAVAAVAFVAAYIVVGVIPIIIGTVLPVLSSIVGIGHGITISLVFIVVTSACVFAIVAATIINIDVGESTYKQINIKRTVICSSFAGQFIVVLMPMLSITLH